MLPTSAILALSVGVLLSINPLHGMATDAARWLAKHVSTPFMISTVTETTTHTLSNRLKERGLTLTAEHSLDEATTQDLKCFRKKQRNASGIIINCLLAENGIETLRGIVNFNEEEQPNKGIPRTLLPSLIKLFALKQLLYANAEREHKAALVRANLYSLPAASSSSSTPSSAHPSTMTTKKTTGADDPDQGVLHNLYNWWSVDYAMEHLTSDPIIQVCKDLLEQGKSPCVQRTIDQETATRLIKFTKRYCRTSSRMFHLIQTNQMDKLSIFYNNLRTKNAILLDPITELYVKRFLMRFQHSLCQERQDFTQRISLAAPLVTPETITTSQNLQLLRDTYDSRISEENKLLEDYADSIKRPLLPPVPAKPAGKPAATNATTTTTGTKNQPTSAATTTPITPINNSSTSTPIPAPHSQSAPVSTSSATSSTSQPTPILVTTANTEIAPSAPASSTSSASLSTFILGDPSLSSTGAAVSSSVSNLIPQPPVPPKPKNNKKKLQNPADDQTTY